MKTIKLHGWLRERFGEQFNLEVRSAAEAIRALCVMIPGFQTALANDVHGFHVTTGEVTVGEETLRHPFSPQEELHIVPVVQGAGEGKSAGEQILWGIVLIAAAYFTSGLSLSTEYVPAGLALSGVAYVANAVGIAMILGGISQLLFAPPKAQSTESPENKPSYAFNGPVNTITQGNCVPVLYGELIHGSQVISAGLYTEDEL